VGVILDTYSGNQVEDDLPEEIRKTAELLGHYHCNDDNERAPGYGGIDFVPIMRALLDIDYQRYCSIEVFDFSLRLEAIVDHLQATGLWEQLAHLQCSPATQEQITYLHEEGYIKRLAELCRAGGGRLDADTYATRRTFEAAVTAAGGCLQAAEAVVSGEVDNAICLVRPPGHHALPAQGMGFCFFNNIVLYISVHQSPLYPGTGTLDEIGTGQGRGFTINVPLPAGAGDEHLVRAHRQIILPALRAYQPQFVLISAGYDGHWRDPLAGFRLTTDAYYRVMRMTVETTQEVCGGRVCVCLEGGYNHRALAGGVAKTVLALQGKPPAEKEEAPVASKYVNHVVDEHLDRAVKTHKSHLQF